MLRLLDLYSCRENVAKHALWVRGGKSIRRIDEYGTNLLVVGLACSLAEKCDWSLQLKILAAAYVYKTHAVGVVGSNWGPGVVPNAVVPSFVGL